MNISNITTCDVCNGEGLGVVVWVSGCDVKCPGCHNKETWDPSNGIPFTEEYKKLIYKELERPEISRITFSGGHPLMPCNLKDIKKLIYNIRKDFPTIKIWLYTGYVFEDLNTECKEIVNMCDVIVDGPYIEKLRDLSLSFKGSSNQRIIKIK